MKVLLFSLLLLPFIATSQKLEKGIFDPIDSVFTIKTKTETLFGKYIRWDYLAFECISHSFKSARFKDLPNANSVTVLFTFRANATTSIDKSSKVKIQFTDNIVKEYDNVMGYRIYSPGDIATATIVVPSHDYLLEHEIKMLRVTSSRGQNDYEIPDKKQSLVTDCLSLIFNYKE